MTHPATTDTSDPLRLTATQPHLTAAQTAAAQAFAAAYEATILGTAPLEREDVNAIERTVLSAYRVAQVPFPRAVRWFASPLALGLAWLPEEGDTHTHVTMGARVLARKAMSGTIMGKPDPVLDEVARAIWEPLHEHVVASVRRQVRDQTAQELRDELRNHESPLLRHADDRRLAMGDAAWRLRAAEYATAALGDADWCGYYGFLARHLMSHHLEPLTTTINQAVHGYHFGREEAWLVRRATTLSRDEQGRLHSATGRAIVYADGWGFSVWHGVVVPDEIIQQPEAITKERYMAERNVEVRRAMQELLGGERFCQMLGATSVHHDECGELVEVALPGDPERRARYVHVKDASTDREYYLRVPPSMLRARQAVAWSFSIPEAEYRPLQEA